MRVKLTYFKPSGKYYSDGELETHFKSLSDIWNAIDSLRNAGCLPGLVDGAFEFIILIDVPEHPHNHPKLLML